MKIAIIGAGFAGVGSAWHLLQKFPEADITIFDDLGIGGEASGIAAGLLHPFVGLRAKLNLFGKEAYLSTCKLLLESEKALQSTVFKTPGLLRLAQNPSQQSDYLDCSKQNLNVSFLNAEECKKINPSIIPFPGILIQDAMTVYVQDYLKGLFLACQKLGVKLEQTKIEELSSLSQFDKVIVTAGAGTYLFKELQHLKLYFVKGQMMELEWPEDMQPLTVPISSKSYILMNQDLKSCIVGATYERNFSSPVQDLSVAVSSIMPKTLQILPGLKNAKIIDCKAAVRVSTKDHLPIVEKINERLFVFVGLGSKGLLYHSFFAEKLAILCTKNI